MIFPFFPLFSLLYTPLSLSSLCLSLSLSLSLSVSLFIDSDMPSSFSINLIDEKIPQCFLQLETAIEKLLVENPNQPLYKREAFW